MERIPHFSVNTMLFCISSEFLDFALLCSTRSLTEQNLNLSIQMIYTIVWIEKSEIRYNWGILYSIECIFLLLM